MQKERGLQRAGDNGGPVNRPVQGVQPARVPKGVHDEREETEDVEVGGVGRGPASEQNVQADAEIDHRNQPHARVHRGVGIL